jgi:hypothetical protein
MFKSAVILTLVVIAVTDGQVSPDISGARGSIDIRVVDSFGRELPASTVYIQHLRDASSIGRIKLTVHRAENVEYGTYLITAEQRNFTSASAEIALRDPVATITLGLAPHAIVAAQNFITVTATLKEPVPPGCDRIRLLPLFLTGSAIDAKLSNNQFTVSDMRAGEYAVVVASSAGVCHIADLTIGLGQPILSLVVP